MVSLGSLTLSISKKTPSNSNPNIRMVAGSQGKTEHLKAKTYVSNSWNVGKWQRPAEVSANKRINPELLELAYKSVPFLNKAINLKALHTISPWFVVEPSELNEDFQKWASQISLKLKLNNLLVNRSVYGYAFAEIIKNRKGDTIDIELIDPKTIMVKINEDGEITEYGQAKPNQPTPEITFKPEEIIHFDGIKLAGDIFGLGDIEPLYTTVETWLNTQDGIANYMYRHGFPKYHVSAKGDNVPEDTLKEIRDEFQTMSNRNEFVTSGDVEIKSIDASDSRVDVVAYQNMGIDLLCSSLGIPKLLMGLGQDVNRATGSLMLESWDRENQMTHLQIDDLLRVIYKQILKTEDYYVEWNEWDTIDENLKSSRLLAELGSGAITVNEYREQMGYEELPEGTLPQPTQTVQPETSNIGMSKTLSSAFYEGVELAEKELNLNVSQNLKFKQFIDDRVLDQIFQNSLIAVKTLDESQIRTARKIFKDAYINGTSYNKLAEELVRQTGITMPDAIRLVRTEMNKALNLGKLMSYKESGVVVGKRWTATLDNHTSDECRRLNGQTKGLNELFVDAKGKTYEYPPQHPNCRCSIQAVVK